MKYLKLLLFSILAFMLFSCGDVADESTLSVTFQGKEYTEDFTINIDAEDTKFTGDIAISAKHYKKATDTQTKDGFEFSCDKVEVNQSSLTEGYIRTDDMVYLGNYTIKAKSLVSSSLDKSITIRVVSNLKSFTLSYNCDKTKENGTIINSYSKLTLERGQSYIFTATPNDGASIKTLLCQTENDKIVYFNNIENNTFFLNTAGLENSQVKVTIKAGYTEIALPFYVEIKDTSDAEIVDYIDTSIPDKVLSFKANPTENLDLSYKYQLDITTFDDNRDIKFSTDAVKIIAEVDSKSSTEYPNIEYKKGETLLPGTLAFERYMIDYPNTIPQVNEDANWYSRIEYSVYGQNDDLTSTTQLYKVEMNGIERTFTIKPLADTIWKDGTLNRKCYLYFKWDDDTSYRWKVRIIIGGVFDSLDLFQVKDGKEISLGEDGYIQKVGESINWKLRARYNPTTFEDNETIFYLASSNKTKKYELHGGNYDLPIPISSEDTLLLSTLTFKDIGIGKEIITSYINGNFELKQGVKCDKNDDGLHDIDIQMSNNGETIYIVALSTSTLTYKCIKVSSDIEAESINKSISNYGSIDKTSRNRSILNLNEKCYVLNNYTSKTPTQTNTTTYKAGLDYQGYPQTISDYNKNYRKFYLPINSEMTLQMATNFEIENITLSYKGDAEHYLSCNSSIDSTQANRVANIKITSAWRQIVMSEDPTYFSRDWLPYYKDYMTDKIGIFFTVTLTSSTGKSYNYTFQFVVFDYNES